MTYYNLFEKAMEHDLEEIKLLARAARTAPPPVRQALLGMMVDYKLQVAIKNVIAT